MNGMDQQQGWIGQIDLTDFMNAINAFLSVFCLWRDDDLVHTWEINMVKGHTAKAEVKTTRKRVRVVDVRKKKTAT